MLAGLRNPMKSILRWIEQKVFTGEVVKDYGVVDERRQGLSRLRTSALLCRQKGQHQIVFRHSARAPFGASVSYTELPATREVIAKLAEVLEDAAAITHREVSS